MFVIGLEQKLCLEEEEKEKNSQGKMTSYPFQRQKAMKAQQKNLTLKPSKPLEQDGE